MDAGAHYKMLSSPFCKIISPISEQSARFSAEVVLERRTAAW